MALGRLIKFLLPIFLFGCAASDNFYAKNPKQTTIEILVDKDFSREEQGLIKEAMKAWVDATSGSVNFIVFWNQEKPGKFQSTKVPEKINGVFIWSIDKDDSSQISKELQIELAGYNGLFQGNKRNGYIILFDKIRPNGQDFLEEIFRATTIHELGHMLGLDHSIGSTIMSPTVGSLCITTEDANRICEIYECIPKPECEQTYDKTFYFVR